MAEIPAPGSGPLERFFEDRIVQVMLEHGRLYAACDYLLHYDDPATFPFLYTGKLLHDLHSDVPGNVARRLSIVRRAVEMWRRIPATPNDHQRDEFVRVFGHMWKELPSDEALIVAHEIVEQALEKPDTGVSASYNHEIHFSSSRQHAFFEILHILRRVDQALTQSLVDSHEQLAVAARRFPCGWETIHEEAVAEAERRKAAGCEPGYILMGSDEQFRLIEAMRRGEFGPAIEHALEEYRQDSSPCSFNYAPKEFWPSTGEIRTVFHQAGKRVGSAAATLLEKIPDPDLRLFATIELAAGSARLPEDLISRRSQPNSPETLRRMPKARLLSVSGRIVSDSQSMRADDGRLIRCPKCLFRPTADLRWTCKCTHIGIPFRPRDIALRASFSGK